MNGGVGLYYRAISKGIFTGSKTDLNIRSLLNDQYEKLGAKLEEETPAWSLPESLRGTSTEY